MKFFLDYRVSGILMIQRNDLQALRSTLMRDSNYDWGDDEGRRGSNKFIALIAPPCGNKRVDTPIAKNKRKHLI